MFGSNDDYWRPALGPGKDEKDNNSATKMDRLWDTLSPHPGLWEGWREPEKEAFCKATGTKTDSYSSVFLIEPFFYSPGWHSLRKHKLHVRQRICDQSPLIVLSKENIDCFSILVLWQLSWGFKSMVHQPEMTVGVSAEISSKYIHLSALIRKWGWWWRSYHFLSFLDFFFQIHLGIHWLTPSRNIQLFSSKCKATTTTTKNLFSSENNTIYKTSFQIFQTASLQSAEL